MPIIILLAILTQFIYPKSSYLQNYFLSAMDLCIDKIRIYIHKNDKLRIYTYKIPRWAFIIIFVIILFVVYVISYKIKLIYYTLVYFISIICINMPINAPWKIKLSNTNLYHKWLFIFKVSGEQMVLEQTKDNFANLELCSKAILSMWCYNFLMPIIFISLPHGIFICLTWIIIRHVCLQIKKKYLIYIIEWIPRNIILIVSATLGNFESCISNAKLEKKLQQSMHTIERQDIESWLWQGVKGAINIDIISSEYQYQQFLIFLSKLVIAITVLYVFTQFI